MDEIQTVHCIQLQLLLLSDQIIIHGSAEATSALVKFSSTIVPSDKVFAPAVGDCVDATTESRIFQVNNVCSLFIKYDTGCIYLYRNI